VTHITLDHTAQAAKNIYKNTDFQGFTLLGGFFDPKNDLTLGWHKEGDAGGGSGGIYKYNNGIDQFILAFRGSSGSPLKGHKDWVTDDRQIGMQQTPDREAACVDYARRIQWQYRGAFILVVGHSLGGYLAQMVGVKCNLPFITYNAPPAGYHFKAGDAPLKYKEGVNLRINWDPVSRAPGKHIGPLITLPHYGNNILDAHTNGAIEKTMARYEHRNMAATGFIRVKNI